MMIHTSIIICMFSTFIKIITAYYSDRQTMKSKYHQRSPVLVISILVLNYSMLVLANCPFSAHSMWVLPWFLFNITTLFISENIFYKVRILFMIPALYTYHLMF